jgi:MoaA/NifB/PqqE/SkfB family radical SAM enzyme
MPAMTPHDGPRQAIVAVTYRCNSRCAMCDVWRKDEAEEVEPSFYYHLPASLREINLTGGEPFLRGDLETITAVMLERAPQARILISTNGLLPERIRRIAPALRRLSKRLGARVSIDGARAETHDRIRGVPGAFDKAWASVEALREAGIRDLGIAYTMTAGNEDELLPLYERARRLGLDFTYAVVHSSALFFGEHHGESPDRDQAVRGWAELRRRQLRSRRVKDWFRAYFTAGLVDLARGQPRNIACPAYRDFFYLDPYGTAYPCHVKDWPLGNLEEGWEKLTARHAEVLRQVDGCPEHCWMSCTISPLMRRDLSHTGGLVLRDRLRALAGRS